MTLALATLTGLLVVIALLRRGLRLQRRRGRQLRFCTDADRFHTTTIRLRKADKGDHDAG